jgi:hypothetical protein
LTIASELTVALPVSPWVWRSVSTLSQVVALDNGDQLPGLHLLAFIDGKSLDAAGDLAADDNFIGVNGADQLQIGVGPHRDEVPDERADGHKGQNKKNSITCVHVCLTSSKTVHDG